MPASFVVDTEFDHSWKMGIVVNVSREKLVSRFGLGVKGDETMDWNGVFTSSDGEEMRASFWQYHDMMNQVSIWIRKPLYQLELIRFLESI